MTQEQREEYAAYVARMARASSEQAFGDGCVELLSGNFLVLVDKEAEERIDISLASEAALFCGQQRIYVAQVADGSVLSRTIKTGDEIVSVCGTVPNSAEQAAALVQAAGRDPVRGSNAPLQLMVHRRHGTQDSKWECSISTIKGCQWPSLILMLLTVILLATMGVVSHTKQLKGELELKSYYTKELESELKLKRNRTTQLEHELVLRRDRWKSDMSWLGKQLGEFESSVLGEPTNATPSDHLAAPPGQHHGVLRGFHRQRSKLERHVSALRRVAIEAGNNTVQLQLSYRAAERHWKQLNAQLMTALRNERQQQQSWRETQLHAENNKLAILRQTLHTRYKKATELALQALERAVQDSKDSITTSFSLVDQARTERLTQQRRVFIDAGMNWGDTYKEFNVLAEGSHKNATNVEVYGFEASPQLFPYLSQLLAWENREPGVARPVSCTPPVGSTHDRMFVAPVVGCKRKWQPKMNACLNRLVGAAHASMALPPPSLYSAATVQQRLATAAVPVAVGPRYTFIPAALGGEASTLEFDMKSGKGAEQLGGMTLFASPNATAGPTVVQVINLADWLIQHFTAEDYVVLKLDVEGAEHSIIHALADKGALSIIDVISLECHEKGGRKCNNGPNALMGFFRERIRSLPSPPRIRNCDGKCQGQKWWRDRVDSWRKDLQTPQCATLLRKLNMTIEA